MHSKLNSSTTFSMEKINPIIMLPMSDELNLQTFVLLDGSQKLFHSLDVLILSLCLRSESQFEDSSL